MGGRVIGSKVGITVAVMFAALMAMIDISIVNVALSDIRASFGTTLSQIGWVSTGYMMSNIVVIPMTGWLQRRFGFRRYFTVSILIFTAASVLCGTAWSLPSLVIFRVLQGLGGGAIIPTAQSILFARYPREQHGMAGAMFGLGAVTGPLLGPTIGGYLIDAASWHWIFLVNIPIGIAAAALSWRHIREPEDAKPAKEKIDAFGIGLLVVGMASLQYILEEGNRDGWDDRGIILLAVVAAISLITFIVHELETPNPVVDLRVFKNRSYASGTGINFLLGVALFAGNFLYSLYCGTVMEYTALDIGRIFLVAGVAQIFLMPLVGRFGGKVDGRILIGGGVLLTVMSLWMNAHLQSSAGFWNLATPQIVRAVGLSFVFVPLSVNSLSSLPAEQRGNATGLFNLTRELGGSIGTALIGVLLDNRNALHTARLAERITAFNPAAHIPLATAKIRVTVQSLILSFNDGFVLCAAVFVCCVALVFFLARPAKGVVVEGAH